MLRRVSSRRSISALIIIHRIIKVVYFQLDFVGKSCSHAIFQLKFLEIVLGDLQLVQHTLNQS